MFQRTIEWDPYIFIQEIAFENVVCECRPFCLGLKTISNELIFNTLILKGMGIISHGLTSISAYHMPSKV